MLGQSMTEKGMKELKRLASEAAPALAEAYAARYAPIPNFEQMYHPMGMGSFTIVWYIKPPIDPDRYITDAHGRRVRDYQYVRFPFFDDTATGDGHPLIRTTDMEEAILWASILDVGARGTALGRLL